MLDLLPSCPGAGCPTHKRSETYCEAKWTSRCFPMKISLHKTAQEIGMSLGIRQKEPTNTVGQRSKEPHHKSQRPSSPDDPDENPDWNQMPEQQKNQTLWIHKFQKCGARICLRTQRERVAQLASTQVCWSLMSFSATPSYDPFFSILSYSIPAWYFLYLIWLIHSAYFLNCIYHFNHF